MSNKEKENTESTEEIFQPKTAVKKKADVRKLTVTAIMAAVSTVLMFLSFSVPFMPSFIKFDFSELPALIAAFALGPVSGITVCLIKNLINLFNTTTFGIGELSNFILGCAFVLPAGLIYKKKKTIGRAFLGSMIGAVASAVISFFSNMFVVYPIYENLMPKEIIIKAYSVILPSVTTLWQAILFFNVPFTFLKMLVDVAITFCVYKYLSPILKGKI